MKASKVFDREGFPVPNPCKGRSAADNDLHSQGTDLDQVWLFITIRDDWAFIWRSVIDGDLHAIRRFECNKAIFVKERAAMRFGES